MSKYTQIDEDTLAPKQQALLKTYRAAYKASQAAKAEFETSIRGEFKVPEGFKLVFGYYWGKFSVTVVKDDSNGKAAPRAKGSLSDYLKGMSEDGLAS